MSSVGVFPRESEGNKMAVNWSLVEEGVVPKGEAFRNCRVSLLTSRLSSKVVDGKVDVKSPIYTGTYEIAESGDDISHDDFEAMLTAQQEYLSSGTDLFVEDGAICASTSARLGVRVVTDSAASALVARSLLISTPLREVDHRTRFDGWNKDPRWRTTVEEGKFEGDKWVSGLYIGESAEDQPTSGGILRRGRKQGRHPSFLRPLRIRKSILVLLSPWVAMHQCAPLSRLSETHLM